EADRARQKELQEKLTRATQTEQYRNIVQEYVRLNQAPAEETPAARKDRLARLAGLQKELTAIYEPLRPIQQELMRFQPSYRYQGNVFLFQRRPPEAAATER